MIVSTELWYATFNISGTKGRRVFLISLISSLNNLDKSESIVDPSDNKNSNIPFMLGSSNK